MTPGLCLDSGEFIPASELNMTHFETKRPKEHTPVMSITEENEKLAKRISFLEGLIHTCSTGCTKAGCVNRVLQQRIAELTESLETASSAVIVLKQQQREGWAQLASADVPVANGETYCKNTDAAWAQFCGGVGDDPSAPHPGMIRAFESYYGQSFADKEWRTEASVWAAAWGKARTEEQPASGQESVALHENIKNLCDQYAQECVQFALGIKAGSGSMSPIASLAGDTRLTLHTAIDCTKPPAQQPASGQEPALWQKKHPLRTKGFWQDTNEHDAKWWINNAIMWEIRPLYTRPAPAQQPLGIEEIQKLAADNATGWFLGPLTFARAIEAKHGIKGKP